ncbi:MAG: hypothetical protein ACI38A_02655 [Candidatus Ornithomonoglobus sp.]
MLKLKKIVSLFLAAAVSVSTFTAMSVSAGAAEAQKTEAQVTLFNQAESDALDSLNWNGDFQNNGRPQLIYKGDEKTLSMSFTANVTTLEKIVVNGATRNSEVYSVKIGDSVIGTVSQGGRNNWNDYDVEIPVTTTEIGDKAVTIEDTTTETYINSVTLVYSNSYSLSLFDADGNISKSITFSGDKNGDQKQLRHINNGTQATLTFDADMTNLSAIVINAASKYQEKFTAKIGEAEIGSCSHEGRSNWNSYDNEIVINSTETGVKSLTIIDETQETYINSVTLIYAEKEAETLTADVENIGAFSGTEDYAETTATAFKTTVSGKGTFSTISWTITSGSEEPKTTESYNVGTITLDGDSATALFGLVVNGLDDSNAIATATVE